MTLPQGWIKAPLAELTEFVTSGSRGWAKYYADDGAAFIRVQNVRRSSISLDLDDVQYVRPPSGTEGVRTRLEVNDVVVTITADLGRVGLFRDDVAAYVNQHVALVRLLDCEVAPYVATFLTSFDAQAQMGLKDRGVTRAGLGLEDIKSVQIQLPPLPEQRRIVAKLETLTAHLTRARAELDRVPELGQKLRRQAMLACFGDASERKVSLGSLLVGIESGKNLRCVERPPLTGERGVIKVSAVTWGRFDPSKSKTLPADYTPPEKARIRKGDLLLSRANTLELVGAPVIVEEQPTDLFLSDKVLRLLVADNDKHWVLWFLRSPAGRSQIEEMSSGNQMSMRNIGQDALRRIVLPYPDAPIRADRIVALEAAFARADRLEAEAGVARALLDRLEAATLAKAFRGELVLQDPGDEPASTLLARIRAQRANAPKAGRGRKLKAMVA